MMAASNFTGLAQADFGIPFPARIALVVLLTGVELAFVAGVLYGFYFLLTLPLRRTERARLLLDVLELGLKDGRTPEQALVDAASSGDRAMGARFQLLATQLSHGIRLSDALTRTASLLPPQMMAMLKAGERIGDVRKVLPACRKLIEDGVSQVRGALNYLLVLTFVITPATITVPAMIWVLVIPKFKEVFAGLGMGTPLPAFTAWIFTHGRQVAWAQLAVVACIWLLMIAYIGGLRLSRWLRRVVPGLPDRVMFLFPWRRRRMERNFSAMLAVLLDAGIAEPEAVPLAAEASANALVQRRAEKVVALLRGGTRLPDALGVLDDSGDFQWRMKNALHGRGGFLRALAGWHDALDAKAFQSEQAAAQIATSAVVIFNGIVVAGVVIGIFMALVDLVMQATLW